MIHIETNINYMPLPYRLAIERLGNVSGDERTLDRFNGICEEYETVYALSEMPERFNYREDAWGIAKRRYGL